MAQKEQVIITLKIKPLVFSQEDVTGLNPFPKIKKKPKKK